jgi:hypothetical protein
MREIEALMESGEIGGEGGLDYDALAALVRKLGPSWSNGRGGAARRAVVRVANGTPIHGRAMRMGGQA